MAYIGMNFDATQVAPAAEYEPLPAGEYEVMISDSGMEPSKSGGQFLKLTLQVLSGPQQGKVLFDRLNLQCPGSEIAERIAQQSLSAICHAVGVMQLQDSSALHHKPLLAKVSVKPAHTDKTGVERGPSNEVKAYKPLSGVKSAPAPAAAYQAPANQPAAAPAGGPPWGNRAAA